MEQAKVDMKDAIPEEIRTWLGGVKSNTGEVYLKNWMGFYDWLQEEGPLSLRGLTPRELMIRQRDLNREEFLPDQKVIQKAILDYVNYGDRGWRTGYKKKIYSSVVSFFVCYLGEGKFPGLSKGDRGKLKGASKTRKLLTIEIIKDIIDNSNVMYKAVWSSMLASGMGIGELVEWSNQGIDTLRKALADPKRVKDEELIEIRLGPRKMDFSDNEFYVYVGGSALGFIKKYMIHREEMEARFYSVSRREKRARHYQRMGKEVPPIPANFPDSIFINNTYGPLTEKAAQFYWISQLKQLKIWTSREEKRKTSDRSNMSIHQIRSIFRTRWGKVPQPRDMSAEAQKALGEYYLGHKIDPNDYLKIENDPEYRIKAYLVALPWFDIKKIDIEQQSEAFKIQQEEIDKLQTERDRNEERINLLSEKVERVTQGMEQARAQASRVWDPSSQSRIYAVMDGLEDGELEPVLKAMLKEVDHEDPESVRAFMNILGMKSRNLNNHK